MRHFIALLLCLTITTGELNAQKPIEYFLVEGVVNFDSSFSSNIKKISIDTTHEYTIAFLYDVSYHKANVVSMNKDSLFRIIEIDFTKDQWDTVVVIRCDSLLSAIFTYIRSMSKPEQFVIFSEHLSTIGDGYLYYIYNRDKTIGSFYSFHNLDYYQINETDQHKLLLLYKLIAYSKISNPIK